MIIQATRGDTHNVLGTTAIIKLTGKDTSGRLAVVEHTVPPHAGPPPHTHDHDHDHRAASDQSSQPAHPPPPLPDRLATSSTRTRTSLAFPHGKRSDHAQTSLPPKRAAAAGP